MSDELTYLRWFHTNAYRFTFLHLRGSSELDVSDAQEAYERETGNRVPNDYRVIA